MDFKLDKIGVYFYNSRGASVRFNARRAIPWDLWDLCEPNGARLRGASVRFTTRRAIPWDL